MNTRTFPARAALSALFALSTLLASSTALAWAVPIHKCTFPKTPTPAGQPIPCSYTNDGQTFNGVVTVTSNGTVLCTGMLAPTPNDETEAQSIDALYEQIGDGDGPDDAPFCSLEGSEEGPTAACYDDYDPEPQGFVQVCGDGWCLELSAYVDCNDYYSTEAQIEGVSCYDIV